VDFCTFVDGVCVACSAPHILSKQVCGVWRPFTADVQPAHGPGTELSKLLKRLGINPTPTCQCRAMSQKMDQWGCDEASKPERIDEVVAVMRAEAEARGLPFLDVAGRMLVRRAISNARRNA
jgi:hypothetical protein